MGETFLSATEIFLGYRKWHRKQWYHTKMDNIYVSTCMLPHHVGFILILVPDLMPNGSNMNMNSLDSLSISFKRTVLV